MEGVRVIYDVNYIPKTHLYDGMVAFDHSTNKLLLFENGEWTPTTQTKNNRIATILKQL